MRNTLSRIALAALVASSSAYGVQYADFDIINDTVSSSHAVIGQFNLVTAGAEGNSADMSGYAGDAGGNGTFGDIGGFALGSSVQDATIAFWFSDPLGGNSDGYKIRIQFTSFFGTVDSNADLDTEQEFQSVVVNTVYHGAEILLSISNTGVLDYKVQTSGSGTFNVDAGMLTVNVPDGGSTAILLGMGMIGMVGLQRKLRK